MGKLLLANDRDVERIKKILRDNNIVIKEVKKESFDNDKDSDSHLKEFCKEEVPYRIENIIEINKKEKDYLNSLSKEAYKNLIEDIAYTMYSDENIFDYDYIDTLIKEQLESEIPIEVFSKEIDEYILSTNHSCGNFQLIKEGIPLKRIFLGKEWKHFTEIERMLYFILKNNKIEVYKPVLAALNKSKTSMENDCTILNKNFKLELHYCNTPNKTLYSFTLYKWKEETEYFDIKTKSFAETEIVVRIRINNYINTDNVIIDKITDENLIKRGFKIYNKIDLDELIIQSKCITNKFAIDLIQNIKDYLSFSVFVLDNDTEIIIISDKHILNIKYHKHHSKYYIVSSILLGKWNDGVKINEATLEFKNYEIITKINF